MAGANDSNCPPETTPNPTECRAPQVENMVVLPPPHRITLRQVGGVTAGVVAGMVLLIALFPAQSGLILGDGGTNGACCSPSTGLAPSPKQPAIVADSCCLPPAGTAAPATDVAKLAPGRPDGPTAVQPSDIAPARNAVFKVQGLECPAVPGLGCGHRLAPELAGLDKREGVERSFANRTGTMIRVTVATAGDRDKVAGDVSKYLTDNKRAPVRLAGDELQRALDKEEWRATRRIAELTGIEFRTLFIGQVREFAEAEKLDATLTTKLIGVAEEEWDHAAGQAAGDVKAATYAKDWSTRCTRYAASFADRAKGMLTAEQHARLKERLMSCCPTGGQKAK